MDSRLHQRAAVTACWLNKAYMGRRPTDAQRIVRQDTQQSLINTTTIQALDRYHVTNYNNLFTTNNIIHLTI